VEQALHVIKIVTTLNSFLFPIFVLLKGEQQEILASTS